MWIIIVFMIWLGLLGIMDIHAGRVSVWLMMAGTIVAAVWACYQCHVGTGNWGGIFYNLIPGGILLAVSKATGKVGKADGIVLLGVGMFMKAGAGFVVFVLSMFLLALFSIILLLMGKAGKNSKIPYLPFLWIACLIQIVSV